MYEKLGTAAKYIQGIKQTTPTVGIVLGSGLGAFVDQIENTTVIPYSNIPFFRNTTVEGHEGRLILGQVGAVEVAVLQGRLHVYEGLPTEEIVFPVRTLATLGIETLILTNAAGGINFDYTPGDLVLIEDHLNMMGVNPLIGPNLNELGPRFPDMTLTYNPKLRSLMQEVAGKMDFNLKSGIYCALQGPTYETPAEIKMLRTLGADMVGMSTVPEAIAANHLGMKVCGVSCITNMAAGMKNVTLKHEDIKIEARKVMSRFSQLLTDSIKKMENLNE
ncbi:MAG: purine-nucleoside phosphorylase [Bdellovibrionales bacterium]|jgi:purine-nucleoside phosphorylase|nr:purine-nucleoside phosphorylase [Bdellovibrionales bacterium]MBT3525423.1 purine-nucleoside phosphorylase [Bdellovibrionales bacterium]MBT7766254.1 purine-nucleoside phosphorylase [Bdellovibrionales bacterium]